MPDLNLMSDARDAMRDTSAAMECMRKGEWIRAYDLVRTAFENVVNVNDKLRLMEDEERARG